MNKPFTVAVALVGLAAVGGAHAQVITYPEAPPRGGVHVDQSGYLRDSRGNIIDQNSNRVIGSNTAKPGPGDYGMPPAAHERYRSQADSYNTNQAIMMPAPKVVAPAPRAESPNVAAYTDEYGFKYNYRGDRLDARGNIISPHTR
jgi:hypothetical protein